MSSPKPPPVGAQKRPLPISIPENATQGKRARRWEEEAENRREEEPPPNAIADAVQEKTAVANGAERRKEARMTLEIAELRLRVRDMESKIGTATAGSDDESESSSEDDDGDGDDSSEDDADWVDPTRPALSLAVLEKAVPDPVGEPDDPDPPINGVSDNDGAFVQRCNWLRAYKSQYGNCEVPRSGLTDGRWRLLAAFIDRMRRYHQANIRGVDCRNSHMLLTPDKVRTLQDIGLRLEMKGDRFEEFFEEGSSRLEALFKRHGHCCAPVLVRRSESAGNNNEFFVEWSRKMRTYLRELASPNVDRSGQNSQQDLLKKAKSCLTDQRRRRLGSLDCPWLHEGRNLYTPLTRGSALSDRYEEERNKMNGGITMEASQLDVLGDLQKGQPYPWESWFRNFEKTKMQKAEYSDLFGAISTRESGFLKTIKWVQQHRIVYDQIQSGQRAGLPTDWYKLGRLKALGVDFDVEVLPVEDMLPMTEVSPTKVVREREPLSKEAKLERRAKKVEERLEVVSLALLEEMVPNPVGESDDPEPPIRGISDNRGAFIQRCNWLRAYKQKYGHCAISRDDPQWRLLRNFIERMRRLHHSNMKGDNLGNSQDLLSPDRVRTLEDIGVSLETRESFEPFFEEGCSRLEALYHAHGHCCVPVLLPQLSESERDGDKYFGVWVKKVRQYLRYLAFPDEYESGLPNQQEGFKRARKVMNDKRTERLAKITCCWLHEGRNLYPRRKGAASRDTKKKKGQKKTSPGLKRSKQSSLPSWEAFYRNYEKARKHSIEHGHLFVEKGSDYGGLGRWLDQHRRLHIQISNARGKGSPEELYRLKQLDSLGLIYDPVEHKRKYQSWAKEWVVMQAKKKQKDREEAEKDRVAEINNVASKAKQGLIVAKQNFEKAERELKEAEKRAAAANRAVEAEAERASKDPIGKPAMIAGRGGTRRQGIARVKSISTAVVVGVTMTFFGIIWPDTQDEEKCVEGRFVTVLFTEAQVKEATAKQGELATENTAGRTTENAAGRTTENTAGRNERWAKVNGSGDRSQTTTGIYILPKRQMDKRSS